MSRRVTICSFLTWPSSYGVHPSVAMMQAWITGLHQKTGRTFPGRKPSRAEFNEGIVSKLGAPGTNFFGGSGGCPNQRLERAYNGASKIGGFPHGDEIRGWGTLSWWASGVWATGSVTDLRSSTCTKVE